MGEPRLHPRNVRVYMKTGLGVCAAEGSGNDAGNFALSEPLRTRDRNVTKGSSTPEFAENFSIEVLPRRLLGKSLKLALVQ